MGFPISNQNSLGLVSYGPESLVSYGTEGLVSYPPQGSGPTITVSGQTAVDDSEAEKPSPHEIYLKCLEASMVESKKAMSSLSVTLSSGGHTPSVSSTFSGTSSLVVRPVEKLGASLSCSTPKPLGSPSASQLERMTHEYSDYEKQVLSMLEKPTLSELGLDTETITKYVEFVRAKGLKEAKRFQKGGAIDPTGFAHTITGTPTSVIIHVKNNKHNPKLGFIGGGNFKNVYYEVEVPLDNPDQYVVNVDYTFRTEREGEQISPHQITDEIARAEKLQSFDFRYVSTGARHFVGYVSPKHDQVRCYASSDRYGPDLKNLVKNGASDHVLFNVLRDCALGLGELQLRGLSHRDIKMDNVLSTRRIVDGRPSIGGVVGDLGFVTDNPERDYFGKGNDGQKPPEFFEAENAGQRAGGFQKGKGEVWSLGIVIYQTIFAKSMYEFPNFVYSMARCKTFPTQEKITEFIDSLPENSEVEKGCKVLLERCLRRNREERPTFQEVAEELDKLAKLSSVTKQSQVTKIVGSLSARLASTN